MIETMATMLAAALIGMAAVAQGAAEGPSAPSDEALSAPEGAAPQVRVWKGNGAQPHLGADEAGAGSCLPAALVDGARIVALGAYQGGVTTRLGMAGASHEVGAIAVSADAAGPPLLLVLTAYDPAIWDFSNFPMRRLRGVIAYGYYPQAVAHVPARIPIRFAIRSNSDGECGEPIYAYEGGSDLNRLAEQVERLLGRPIEAFQGGYEPTGFHVDGGTPGPVQLARLTTKALRSSAHVARDPVAPREQGLAELVASGAIRPATRADVEAWNAAATRNSPTGHLAPVRAKSLTLSHAYVVLKPTPLPKGMYGAHSRAFLIPPGVPAPVDQGSHNSFYHIATGTCTGPGSNC